ncbi:Fe2+-dependent dioxygenase [Pseudomaricurvus sp. HS19]|uniref:Fe2+-dependent dioxygenase n=1 Tax=Pseudomaricurvus sp. HS19 TaxID=2692626 RepID=UPI00136CF93B|nr:Fe2+-dependent dioxygenase [Pseudomaricurvus sp. HS19]MYM63637.1 Fe2+-dependent dioxygenase [Pseudomaricurvus sp. HS19]
MLLPIENLLSKEEVKQMRLHLDQHGWLDGSDTAGGIARTVKFNQQADEQQPQIQQLQQFLLQKISRHPLSVSAALPEKIHPPKFNRYADGGSYGLHVDSAIMYLAGGESLRTDVSATIFLCEPDSYDGGELVIETQYGAQSVKLNAGDMIVYPSSSLHEVRPVTRGARVCSFFWIQSLVRSAQQREQLFDLDQVVQTLTVERGADDQQVRSLSALYHNLMRNWAAN